MVFGNWSRGMCIYTFRDANRVDDVAEALKPIPSDLVQMGICDEIVDEPNGGAHKEILNSF